VAAQAKARYIFAEKENNVLVLRRGFTLSPGEPVLVVEDVVTRGGRVLESLEIVAKPVATPSVSRCWGPSAASRLRGRSRPLSSSVFPRIPPTRCLEHGKNPVEKPGS